MLTGWEVSASNARIGHLYTYSPLEPWEARTVDSVERRVFCHALIDLAPDDQIDALLLEVGRFLSRQLAISDQDGSDESPNYSMGPKSARMLRSLFAARLPLLPPSDEEEGELGQP
jgi:hypothetical protein